MGWAKIELEFRPEDHDANTVMTMLADYFRHKDSGLPTAVINLVGITPDELLPDSSDITKMADYFWQIHDPKKIDAIKDLRMHTHLGLKDAKDAIDAAIARNPF